MCPLVVLHGKHGACGVCPYKYVKTITDLAIVEQRTPVGLRSFYRYEMDVGYFFGLSENPYEFVAVYRRALKNQLFEK